jgi:citrate lyase subunit beta/citryl-CoA lyase
MSKPAVSRAAMYMPIVERRFVESAWRRDCDAVILDLEDSVPPHLKQHARDLVKDSIPLIARGAASVLVRVNSDSVREDLEASVWPGLDMIILPKAESAEQVARAAGWLGEIELRRNMEQGSVGIWPLVETAVGVSNAYAIAAASDRVWWFGGGQGYDMSLDLEADMFVGFDQFEYCQGETELAARALGSERVLCFFFPDTSGAIGDRAGAVEYGRALKDAGFRIATAVHPVAVQGLNEGLTPSEQELADARATLARLASARDVSSSGADALVVDHYEVQRARDLIDWADACRAKDAEKAAARRRVERLADTVTERMTDRG